ncbi:hypothetical protein SC1_03982 [Sphingopyxis sp. C-1]|nr:hypothetical protein SC1_03982 [Sphingopyxis sp. C-1]
MYYQQFVCPELVEGPFFVSDLAKKDGAPTSSAQTAFC